MGGARDGFVVENAGKSPNGEIEANNMQTIYYDLRDTKGQQKEIEDKNEEIFEQMDHYVPCGHRTAASLRSGSVGYAFWLEEFLRQTQEFLQTTGR